jgi:alanyl-tRNA synthetase
VTERLYYGDSYLEAFSATVTTVDGLRVYLDRTAFYPTSGGQPFDTGTLGGARVVDVIDEEHRLAHVLSAPPSFAAGATVDGTIDWPRRFDNMQQHTGQHLLSAVFDDLFGHKTVSVHFGDASSTLDLDTDLLSRDRVERAERKANEIVLENRPVRVGFEDAATASALRKPSDRTGDIRIVTIENTDRSACGGTHVRSTGEIGPVIVRRAEKYKKLIRLEFLCGWRALARSRADFDTLTTMAGALTTSVDELPALVAAQAASLRDAESDRRKLGDELARFRVRELHAAAKPDGAGVRRITARAASMDEMRALAQAAGALPLTLFCGTVATPPAITFAASEDTGINAGAALKTALAAHNGRGGGSPRVAQGTAESAAAIELIERQLLA